MLEEFEEARSIRRKNKRGEKPRISEEEKRRSEIARLKLFIEETDTAIEYAYSEAEKYNTKLKRKLISSYYIKELLIPIFIDGKLVYNLPSLSEIRTHCVNETNSFWNEILRIDNPHSYYVDLSYDLWSLKQNLIYKK